MKIRLSYAEAHLVRLSAFDGKYTLELSRDGDEICPKIRSYTRLGGFAKRGEGLHGEAPFRTGNLPEVEERPCMGECDYGEAWYYASVEKQSDGSLLVIERCVANFSERYCGDRRSGEEHTFRVPAQWVRAVRAAEEGKIVRIIIENDTDLEPAQLPDIATEVR